MVYSRREACLSIDAYAVLAIALISSTSFSIVMTPAASHYFGQARQIDAGGDIALIFMMPRYRRSTHLPKSGLMKSLVEGADNAASLAEDICFAMHHFTQQ